MKLFVVISYFGMAGCESEVIGIFASLEEAERCKSDALSGLGWDDVVIEDADLGVFYKNGIRSKNE